MKVMEDFQGCAELLKALADPDRLRIVQLLFDGAKSVTDISDELGEDVPKISHHLGILRRAKILLAKKEGRFVVYSVHPSVRPKSHASTKRHINLGCCRVELDA